jgi:hypothetical protein
MSVTVENEFYRVPGANNTEVTRHLAIRGDQLYISTEGEFFTKGIKLVYSKGFPQAGTTITFLTDGSITSMSSDAVTFAPNDDNTGWTTTIPPDAIKQALNNNKNFDIDFTATGPSGTLDPQIRVTPFSE